MDAVTLNYPQPDAPISLSTDASQRALGASLDQFVNGSWRPLGFWSKSLTVQQSQYTTFRRETMAVQLAMRHFREDFEGRHLVVFSDHRPLINAFKQQNPQIHDPHAQNAINEIGMYTSDLRFKEGKKLLVPDLLSRPPDCPLGSAHQVSPEVKYVPPEDTIAALEEVALNILSPASIQEAQADCPDVRRHRLGDIPKNVVVGDVVMSGQQLFCEISDPQNPRPMVPRSQRDLVLNLLHHADHPGQKETARRACSQYYWPGMRKNIAGFVKTCHPCQLAKQARTVHPGIGDFHVPDKRFSFVHLDIVGPLPESNGFKYLVTILDRTSRWLEAVPIRQDSSVEVCRAFMDYVSRFGLPDRVFSDNGNAFVANLFQDMMKTFNIQVNFSPAYHAATNGAIERAHQTLKNGLKAALVDMGNQHRDQWHQALPWVLLGKRVQYQPHLDASSAQLVLGKSPTIPGQVLGDPGPPLNTTQIRALLQQLYQLHDRPGIPMSGARFKNDISSTDNATHVYIKVVNPQSLCSKFEGPYEVVSRPSRSQLTVKIGSFKDGSPRLQTYNWSSAKVAHLREGAQLGSRPALGRPPVQPVHRPATGSEPDASLFTSDDQQTDPPSLDSQSAKIQTPKSTSRYPQRSTRNKQPNYS